MARDAIPGVVLLPWYVIESLISSLGVLSILGNVWLCFLVLASSCTNQAPLSTYSGPYWAELALLWTQSDAILWTESDAVCSHLHSSSTILAATMAAQRIGNRFARTVHSSLCVAFYFIFGGGHWEFIRHDPMTLAALVNGECESSDGQEANHRYNYYYAHALVVCVWLFDTAWEVGSRFAVLFPVPTILDDTAPDQLFAEDSVCFAATSFPVDPARDAALIVIDLAQVHVPL